MPAAASTNLPALVLPNVRMTAEDYVTVNFRLWRARPATRRAQWILVAAIALLALSVGLEVRELGRIQNWSTVAFLTVAGLYAAFRLALVRYQLRRGYSRNPAAQEPVDFTLSLAEVRGCSNQGTFTSSWSRVKRAVWVQPNWLLLYPSEAACYYLDLRRLQAPATPADIEQLLARHQIALQRV
ncbi:hypothetical protein [Hymenobacter glacieicola]|uniref:YcxB-like protein domain-containing protein n=1 Tax=Hymenobacter glacieicola TaxID=1562124 RepID=A0ABQ1WM03_9BACT|nr:hypothetical protein [Hymenobacter glacieicola]GGG36659.1 hypothetical protein GCM10011378_11320 [Hymenobacter glacieicola]